jgi:DNA-directed RNA polymerase subunit RPC12/RpoP
MKNPQNIPEEAENKAAWLQVLRTVQTGSAEEVLRLKCATCGSSLQIVCTPGKRTSLAIRCAACSSAIALDGESEAPPWVESTAPDIGRMIS